MLQGKREKTALHADEHADPRSDLILSIVCVYRNGNNCKCSNVHKCRVQYSVVQAAFKLTPAVSQRPTCTRSLNSNLLLIFLSFAWLSVHHSNAGPQL